MRGVATIVLLCAGFASVGMARAKPLSYSPLEETATFRPGPGVELVQNHCAACHSVDYIAYQPPKRGRAFWEAEVQKMVKLYGAPIDETDAKAMVDYLVQIY